MGRFWLTDVLRLSVGEISGSFSLFSWVAWGARLRRIILRMELCLTTERSISLSECGKLGTYRKILLIGFSPIPSSCRALVTCV